MTRSPFWLGLRLIITVIFSYLMFFWGWQDVQRGLGWFILGYFEFMIGLWNLLAVVGIVAGWNELTTPGRHRA